MNRPGLAGDSISWEYRVVTNIKRYSPEVRERAVRMVFEHVSEYSSQWESICSIATKIGCTAETLRKWVDWFNNRRLLEPIGNIPSVEFEQQHYYHQEAPAMVAGLT